MQEWNERERRLAELRKALNQDRAALAEYRDALYTTWVWSVNTWDNLSFQKPRDEGLVRFFDKKTRTLSSKLKKL